MKFSFLVLLLLIFGCSSDISKKENKLTNGSIKYAKLFNFVIREDSTILQIFDPESHKIQREYTISKKTLGLENNIVTPIKSIVPLSSTHIGMLSVIDGINKVIGVSDSNYVYNQTLLRLIKSGKVIQVGGEGMESVEKIIKLQPAVLMYSGFGKEFHREKQLIQLGINAIPNYDWRENHPLGKAEWIKVFGLLLGKEKEANDYFEMIEKSYFELKAKARNVKNKKSLISGHLVGDVWFAPAGESYNCQFYKDANINYLYSKSKGTGSIKKSLEEILIENKEVDFWLNCNANSLKELKQFQNKYTYLAPYQNKQIFDYSINGRKFWEMSAIEPQKVLSDLINIAYPTLLVDNKLYFYSHLK